MMKETIRFVRASYLDDTLEVLVKLLKQYFDMFGLNMTAFQDGKYAEGSNELVEIILSQYEALLKTARCLGISEPVRELTTNPEGKGSPGDIVLNTLHNTIALLHKVEPELDQLQLGAAAVLKQFREQSTEEDTEMAIRYGAYFRV
jgi:hypothetical protein